MDPQRCRVLIADDSGFSRRFTQTCLPNDRDWSVEHAANGVEVVQMFQQFRPDLILLDLTMPEMDGFEALERMMAIDDTATVVVCTADLHPEARDRVQVAGASAFITKPVTPENLARVVAAIM